jgi:hypothetical protein
MKNITKKNRRKGKNNRLNIWERVLTFRKLQVSDKIIFPDGINFQNTFLYIRAAAGRSIWNRVLSLLLACGYFFAYTSLKSSDL